MDETSIIRSHVTGRIFKIRQDTTCTSSNAFYIAYNKLFDCQGVGFTLCSKPWLSNYKSLSNKFQCGCRIVKYFVEVCDIKTLKTVPFILADALNKQFCEPDQ